MSTQRLICKMFIVVLFVIAQKWKQLKCPSTGEWINKLHPQKGLLLRCKKEHTVDTWNNFGGSQDIYAEFNKAISRQKITYDMIPFEKLQRWRTLVVVRVLGRGLGREEWGKCKGVAWGHFFVVMEQFFLLTVAVVIQISTWSNFIELHTCTQVHVKKKWRNLANSIVLMSIS